MFTKNIKFSLIVLIIFLANNLFAQKEKYKEEITIVAPYKPDIIEANKINVNPLIKKSVLKKSDVTYVFKSKNFSTPKSINVYKPAKLADEKKEKLKTMYLKFGLGNYTTPYGELFISSPRSKKGNIGVHLKHISSTGKIENVGPSDYSNDLAEIFGKAVFDNSYLSTSAKYSRNLLHFYGYNPADFLVEPDKNDTKQIFTLYNFNLKFKSTNQYPEKLNYSSNFKYYHFSDNYTVKEDRINANILFDKDFELFDFTDKQNISLLTDFDFYNNSSVYYKKSNNFILKFQPNIKFNLANINLKVGVNASIVSDSVSDVYLYPDIELNTCVSDSALYFYAGVSGNIHKNSFKSITDENPFVISDIPLSYQNNKFHIYGGIKGHVKNNFNYSISASNTVFENAHFFVKDTNFVLKNKFTCVFDDGNVFKIHAEFDYKINNKLNFILTPNFYSYSIETEDKPWYKPEFDISLSAKYIFNNNFTFNTGIFVFDKMYYKSYTGNNIVIDKTIKSAVDLNFSVDYKYSEMLSAFLNLNNIASQKYSHWENYPLQRFNLMLGINMSF